MNFFTKSRQKKPRHTAEEKIKVHSTSILINAEVRGSRKNGHFIKNTCGEVINPIFPEDPDDPRTSATPSGTAFPEVTFRKGTL